MTATDEEAEFYRLAARLHATDEHDEQPPIDWRVALFYATYLTATAVGYYYIARRIWRAVWGES